MMFGCIASAIALTSSTLKLEKKREKYTKFCEQTYTGTRSFDDGNHNFALVNEVQVLVATLFAWRTQNRHQQ